ncbi:MAG: hypothetical protein KatS3mg093_083 [Candidatus Parcubacteria bacterium]|nr:MAG: hypothetical protein KatS3mg093_083 [Candidatus Parcubacteria bacterium]
MSLKLPFEFKKIIFGLALFANLGICFLVLSSKLTLSYKIFLFLFLLCLFLSLLVIFEAINSFTENLFFWSVIAIFSSFIYWPLGLIILFLSILKFIDKNRIYQTRLKFPFLELISKDYSFIILIIIVSANLFIYQTLLQAYQFPLSFNIYSQLLENFVKIFNINLPLNEKASDFLKNYIQSQTGNSQLSLFSFINVPDQTIKELIYESLKNGWHNEKVKFWYIISILLLIDTFLYPLLILLGRIISLISLIFVNLLSFLKLFKIETKSVNKEIITF